MQSDSRQTASTLELVVNEQQLHNMSQIDLNRPSDNLNSNRLNCQQANNSSFNFEQLKNWPSRFREGFGAKLDEAKSKSETRTQYVFEVLHAFSGILVWILCFLFTILVPVVLLFVGLANLDDCASRPSLPYLVFAIGFVMTASNLFNLALALDLPVLANHQLLSSEIKNTIASILNIIFNCVVAFLYVLCAYMVLTINKLVNRNAQDVSVVEEIDCNATLYSSTFWFVVLTLGTFVLLSLMAAVLFAYNRYRIAIVRGSTPRSHQNHTHISTTNLSTVQIDPLPSQQATSGA